MSVRVVLVLAAIAVCLASLAVAAPIDDGESLVYRRQQKIVRGRPAHRSYTVVHETFRTLRQPPSLARTDSATLDRFLMCDARCQLAKRQRTRGNADATRRQRPAVAATTPQLPAVLLPTTTPRPAFILPTNPYENHNPDYTNLLHDVPVRVEPIHDEGTIHDAELHVELPAETTSTSTTTESPTTTEAPTTTSSTTTEAPTASTPTSVVPSSTAATAIEAPDANGPEPNVASVDAENQLTTSDPNDANDYEDYEGGNDNEEYIYEHDAEIEDISEANEQDGEGLAEPAVM